MSYRILAIGALAAGLCAVSGASAGVIYQDNFSRSGDLNGSPPAPTDTNAATWTSTAGEYTVNNGSASVAAAGANSGYNAFLPLSVSAAGTYTLTATLTPTANSGDSDWLAAGFLSAGSATSSFQSTSNPQLWVLYRENGGTQTFFGGSTNNSANGGTAGTPGSSDTFTLTLNSSTGAFSISDSQGLVNRTGTLSMSSISAINDVGIGQYNTATGSFSGFQASTTAPEPASMSLLGMGALGLLARRRRA